MQIPTIDKIYERLLVAEAKIVEYESRLAMLEKPKKKGKK